MGLGAWWKKKKKKERKEISLVHGVVDSDDIEKLKSYILLCLGWPFRILAVCGSSFLWRFLTVGRVGQGVA